MDPVKGYKTFRTTMGHKVRVRMSAEEIAERSLFHTAIVCVPFLAAAFMFLLWVKMG